MFRIGTRNLVTLPQRVTDAFANMLTKYHPVFVHTHFNHPKECTQEAFDACAKLADAGCVINNQMVLLKGVNDDPEIVMELNHKLLMMRVRPYYIFQCDMSQGISHFRTPIEVGINIIEKLRGWTSGMAVPHFVSFDNPALLHHSGLWLLAVRPSSSPVWSNSRACQLMTLRLTSS